MKHDFEYFQKIGGSNRRATSMFEGYLESGKTFGNEHVYVAGSSYAADFKEGWDLGKKEIADSNERLGISNEGG